jgi:hypothetical protein
MKNSFILMLAGVLFCINSFSQTADQEAIKKVCINETQAYTDFDYDNWASYHVQTANEQLAWNNPDGSFGSESGWEAISKGIKDWFKTGKKENVKLSSNNFSFVVHNDMAFVSFDRSSQNAEGKITKIKEYRTLLHNKGQWKILAVQAYVDYPSGK